SYGLRPKKPPVPKDERRINLISARESYADFHCDNLVVPDDVPIDEASLPSDLLVQALHLLQDLLPIAASHQPPASSDPEERLRDAYTVLYRLVRSPPRWHPELAAAARAQNLLGALGSGGPFAKLVERAEPGSETPYAIDLRYLADYPVRPGLAPIGCRINYDAPEGRLTVAHVEYRDRKAAPGDAGWDFIERIALCSLVTHLTVWRHGMQYHVAGVAPVAVVTHNLPADHPLRRLLAAHTASTISVDYNTHMTLRRSGYDVTGFSFPRETIFRYYDDGAAAFDLNRLDVRADAERRGIGDDLWYPYLPQAVRYYDLIAAYVTAYIDHYYADDAALAGDAAAQAWFDELDRSMLKGVRYFAPSLTKRDLARLCTVFIYAVTFEHEQNTMWDYAVFLPSSVREDGRPQSVGEVQNVLNFQLVISSATNRLLDDFSHLALDPGAARIMRDFRASLRMLQTELEAEGDHYWVVYPQDLEASVSA
ncbi:MAG: lipoxygenase family protein, partial [Acidimicrobiales bacterium]